MSDCACNCTPDIYASGSGATSADSARGSMPTQGHDPAVVFVQGDWVLFSNPKRNSFGTATVCYGIKSDGSLWGWGDGPLGDGTPFGSIRPKFIDAGPWSKVDGRVGLKEDGTIWLLCGDPGLGVGVEGDFTGIDCHLSTTVEAIEVLDGGLYTTPPEVGIALAFPGETLLQPGDTGSGAAAEAFLSTSVAVVVVTNGGSGYESAPSVVLAGNAGDIPCQARAIVVDGSIAAVEIDRGGRYEVGPGDPSALTVSFVGGGGAGAQATAYLVGPVARIDVTNGGSNYSNVPRVRLTRSTNDQTRTVMRIPLFGSVLPEATAEAVLGESAVTRLDVKGSVLGGKGPTFGKLLAAIGTQYGSGLSSAQFVGGGGAGNGDVSVSGGVATITAQGQGYLFPPHLRMVSQGGSVSYSPPIAIDGPPYDFGLFFYVDGKTTISATLANTPYFSVTAKQIVNAQIVQSPATYRKPPQVAYISRIPLVPVPLSTYHQNIVGDGWLDIEQVGNGGRAIDGDGRLWHWGDAAAQASMSPYAHPVGGPIVRKNIAINIWSGILDSFDYHGRLSQIPPPPLGVSHHFGVWSVGAVSPGFQSACGYTEPPSSEYEIVMPDPLASFCGGGYILAQNGKLYRIGGSFLHVASEPIELVTQATDPFGNVVYVDWKFSSNSNDQGPWEIPVASPFSPADNVRHGFRLLNGGSGYEREGVRIAATGLVDWRVMEGSVVGAVGSNSTTLDWDLESSNTTATTLAGLPSAGNGLSTYQIPVSSGRFVSRLISDIPGSRPPLRHIGHPSFKISIPLGQIVNASSTPVHVATPFLWQWFSGTKRLGVTTTGQARWQVGSGPNGGQPAPPSLNGLAAGRRGVAIDSAGRLLALAPGPVDSFRALALAGDAVATVASSGDGYIEPARAVVQQNSSLPQITFPQLQGKLYAVGVINGGSGYRSAPSISIGNAQAFCEIAGPVDSITVTNGGSGYNKPPKVVFSEPGIPASAFARIQSGSVVAVEIYYGGRYRSAPTITFEPVDGGNGAAATCTINGSIIYAEVTNGGSGFTSTPAVEVAGNARLQALILYDYQPPNQMTAGIAYGDAPAIAVNVFGQAVSKFPDRRQAHSAGLIFPLTDTERQRTLSVDSYRQVSASGLSNLISDDPSLKLFSPPQAVVDGGTAIIPTTTLRRISSAFSRLYCNEFFPASSTTYAPGFVAKGQVSNFSLPVTSGDTAGPLFGRRFSANVTAKLVDEVGYGATATSSRDGEGRIVGWSISTQNSVPYTTKAKAILSVPKEAVGGAAVAIVQNGKVSEIHVQQGGRYDDEPTVVLGGNAKARAILGTPVEAVVIDAVLQAFTPDYIKTPSVVFVGGGEIIRATATVNAQSDQLQITITNPGAYTGTPDVYVTGLPKRSVKVFMSPHRTIARIDVTDGGSGYESAPSVAIMPADSEPQEISVPVAAGGQLDIEYMEPVNKTAMSVPSRMVRVGNSMTPPHELSVFDFFEDGFASDARIYNSSSGGSPAYKQEAAVFPAVPQSIELSGAVRQGGTTGSAVISTAVWSHASGDGLDFIAAKKL